MYHLSNRVLLWHYVIYIGEDPVQLLAFSKYFFCVNLLIEIDKTLRLNLGTDYPPQSMMDLLGELRFLISNFIVRNSLMQT